MKIIFISFFILLLNFSFPKETLGLVTKSKGKVEYQKFDSNKFTSKITKGLGLYGDDQIRTGDNGFSIYRYLGEVWNTFMRFKFHSIFFSTYLHLDVYSIVL